MDAAYKQLIADLEALAQRYADTLLPLSNEEFRKAKERGNILSDAIPSTRQDVLHDIFVDFKYHCEDRIKKLG